jgi:uncharacterized protein DUF5906
MPKQNVSGDPLNDYPGASGDEIGTDGVNLEDFFAFMPMHNYVFVPCRTPWPAVSVNARIPPVALFDADGNPVLDDKGKQKHIPAATWLDQNRPVEQMTWAPGHPILIRDQLIDGGGWMPRTGVACLNLYRPPLPISGNPAGAERWLNHVYTVYPDDAEHIIRWLAHRVQRPAEKLNHAIVLGGEQGIGKDSLLEPVKRGVGAWNWQEENPSTILDGRFNSYLKAVVLRLSEARDLGDFDRFRFYDHMKAIIAAPPDILRINEKHIREHYIPNLCGVIITTNHKTDGIFLSEDDRRHFVAWSPRKRRDFTNTYWTELWHYYDRDGGTDDVAAFLAQIDLSSFNPKAPPPQTPAFWDIVSVGRQPEDAEMADALDLLNNPNAVTLTQIINNTKNSFGQPSDFGLWLSDRANRRRIAHRLETCGYVAVRNPTADDGLWKIGERRQTIYALASLNRDDQVKAAEELVSSQRKKGTATV